VRRSRTLRWSDNQISVIPVAIFTLKPLRRARAAAEAPLGINGQGGNELSGAVYVPRSWYFWTRTRPAGRHTYSRIRCRIASWARDC
jgi:hypothetical protein